MPLPSWLFDRDPYGYDDKRRTQICGNDVELFRYGPEWLVMINGMDSERIFISETAAEAWARERCEAEPYPDEE